MNTLIALTFKHDEEGAEKALLRLRSMEREYLMDLTDAVVVRRREDGKVKLTQSVNLIGLGVWEGAFWGSVIGLLFTGPLGLLVGGGVGAGFGQVPCRTLLQRDAVGLSASYRFLTAHRHSSSPTSPMQWPSRLHQRS